MLRAFLLVMLVSCGGGESSTSPGVASGVAVGAEAGKVREITGKVTAARGSEVRTLAVGNPISADDMIDTGTDGSVVIELVHNNALWSLESGIKARVDQSPAWTLAKQDAAKPIDHATSAAGRHAERQAADTQVTAVEAPAAPNTAAAPTDKRAPDADATARPETKRKGAATAPKITAPTTTTPPPPPPPPPPSGAGDAPDAPDRSSVMAAIQAVKPKLTRCFDKLTASGTVKIQIKFGSSGKVDTAEIKETPDHATDACVLKLVRTVTVPASRNGLAVSFPITLRGSGE